jgi:ketosteroid isomerase-like protein
MSETSVEIVRRLFELFDGDGLESALDLLADDFVAEVPGSMSAEPDVYEGREGVRRYFAAFDGFIDDVRFEPLELVPVNDAVVVRLRLSGRGTASGIAVEQHAAVVARVRDGKVTRLDPHPDIESALQALGG